MAVSDELSNEPLGTLMIFSTTGVHPELAWELHELAFEFANAVRKVEVEAGSRREITKQTYEFLNHEIRHAEIAIQRVRDLEVAKGISRALLYILKSSLSVAGVEVAEEFLQADELFNRVKYFEKIYPGQVSLLPEHLSNLEKSFRLDWRFAFILIEAIRNGVRHAVTDQRAKVLAHVGFTSDNALTLNCQSEPHSVQDINNHIEMMNAPLVSPVTQSQRGIRWIKLFCSELNHSVYWSAEKLADEERLHRIHLNVKPL